MTSRPKKAQASKRDRRLGDRARRQRSLFDTCSTRRETIEALELLGCPLCGRPAEEHEYDPEPVADDAPFDEWMLNLPRGQA